MMCGLQFYGAIIKAGVRVGDGAVIGMGAVVTKDVDAYSIVCGNPAKLIKYRFNEGIRNSLMEIQWWNMDEERLKHYTRYIKDPRLLLK